MDSDGKWTILVHKAHKRAVITVEPSLAHSFCMKEDPAFEISSTDSTGSRKSLLGIFSFGEQSHQGDV